ncbi:MAG: plasmid mobilization protein [Oscillospiraceae bacterium]
MKNTENKEYRITVRLSPEELERIETKAETAHMPVSTYMRACALRHKVIVMEGVKERSSELKAIGRNLNQLTVLAHEGRIQLVNLDGVESALEKNYIGIQQLAELERR